MPSAPSCPCSPSPPRAPPPDPSTRPPPGPVASTYKTLAQVEPRTPLGPDTTPGDASAIYIITQPGSYYLAAGITGPSDRDAIRIAASNVTIDLGGFAILGTRGIVADGVRRNIVVRNGTMAGGVVSGVNLSAAQGCTVEDLVIDSIAGIGLRAGDIATVRRITVRSCSGEGVTAGPQSRISDTLVAHNGATGITATNGAIIERCAVHDNAVGGILVNTGCVVRDNALEFYLGGSTIAIRALGSGNRIEGNALSRGNGSAQGIRVDAAGNLIVRNSVGNYLAPYNFAAGNAAGPIVTAATIATNANPHANYEF